MAISSRAYIVSDENILSRVPQRVLQGLIFGEDALPDYAGTRQKVADVLIENQASKPVRILDVRGSYFDFDANGKVDEALRDAAGEWMNYAFSSHGRSKKQQGVVVDLVPELKRKDLHDRHRWPITKDLIDLIAADIWPGIHGPAPDVSTVKGKAPKKPPLTREAKWALEEIDKQVEAIKNRLGMLSERSLKGLAFEAVRHGLWEDEILWRGIADEARRRQAIRAAHRTGRGEWFAVIELARADSEHPYCWEVVAVEHVKGPSREAAIEAGRTLMAEKAEWVGEDLEINVNIRSALEWQPEDR